MSYNAEEERKEAHLLWKKICQSGKREFKIPTRGLSRIKVFWVDSNPIRRRGQPDSIQWTLYRSRNGTIPVNIDRSLVLLRNLIKQIET